MKKLNQVFEQTAADLVLGDILDPTTRKFLELHKVIPAACKDGTPESDDNLFKGANIKRMVPGEKAEKTHGHVPTAKADAAYNAHNEEALQEMWGAEMSHVMSPREGKGLQSVDHHQEMYGSFMRQHREHGYKTGAHEQALADKNIDPKMKKFHQQCADSHSGLKQAYGKMMDYHLDMLGQAHKAAMKKSKKDDV